MARGPRRPTPRFPARRRGRGASAERTPAPVPPAPRARCEQRRRSRGAWRPRTRRPRRASARRGRSACRARGSGASGRRRHDSSAPPRRRAGVPAHRRARPEGARSTRAEVSQRASADNRQQRSALSTDAARSAATDRQVRSRRWVMKRRATAFAAAAAVLAIASSAGATSLRVIHSFGGPDGVSPASGLVDGGDGFLYGTTFYGGNVVPDKNPDGYGTIFRVDSSGAFQTVHRFDRVNGERPNGLVRGPDGLLYGTTSHGGDLDPGSFSGGQGTLFRIDGSGTLTVLHRFLPVEGLWPSAAPTFGMDGAVYGTASDDSTYPHYGTIWRWSPASGLQVLHQFNGFDGVEPLGSLTLASDGNLYGTTNGGGSGCGTVFRLSPTGVHTLLHSFSFNDGCQPKAGVIEALVGNFYGTTETGLGWGTVFRMDRAGNVTTLHAFTATGETGQKPLAPLFEASDGYLYGTTKQGGLPYGGA